MKLLVYYGGAYRITERKYRLWLKAVAAGGSDDLEQYAKFLGEVIAVSDITPEEASYRLEDLEAT
jgi:hypothetical protein